MPCNLLLLSSPAQRADKLIYEHHDPQDGRDEVFAAWLERDLARDPEALVQLEMQLCERLVCPHPNSLETYRALDSQTAA